jgi:hypothetical protein
MFLAVGLFICSEDSLPSARRQSATVCFEMTRQATMPLVEGVLSVTLQMNRPFVNWLDEEGTYQCTPDVDSISQDILFHKEDCLLIF